MFFCSDPKILEKNFKNLYKPKKPEEDFDTYFNKRYLEEIKQFIEKPKFSMKYFMVMHYIRQTILEKSKKEYINKYNLSADYFDNHKVDLTKTSKAYQVDNTVETDIIKEINEEVNQKENLHQVLEPPSESSSESKTHVRRSARLRNKSN